MKGDLLVAQRRRTVRVMLTRSFAAASCIDDDRDALEGEAKVRAGLCSAMFAALCYVT